MEKKAWAVIGSGFGDEGKGLMTDAISAGFGGGCLVVRFNGGAQAGHTVTLASGERHVFGHFGAGTLAGAPTFLSRFFVVNPILFLKERAQLIKTVKGNLPEVYADRDALLSTPWDMMINQAIEQSRGGARHGSCGIGFGETIERCLSPIYRTTVNDLSDMGGLIKKLNLIRDRYVPERLKAIGLNRLPSPFDTVLTDPEVLRNFAEDASLFENRVTVTDAGILNKTERIVFEGAQGLLLDEYHRWFPHVTRSRTGLANVLILAREAGIKRIDVSYMARAYLTRHGTGPLPFEVPEKPYEGIVDLTNIPNAYQGALRFAWMNLDLLSETVANDLGQARNMDIRPELVVTCVDQVGDSLSFVNGNRLRVSRPADAIRLACARLGFSRCRISEGPTRETVSKLSVQ